MAMRPASDTATTGWLDAGARPLSTRSGVAKPPSTKRLATMWSAPSIFLT
jgi:hypothetical protein